MERSEIKWFASAMGVLIVAAFFLFSMNWRGPQSRTSMDDIFTVSMPRPIKEMILGFSLAGRNIKRELEVAAQSKKPESKEANKNSKGATKALVDKGAAAKRAAHQAREVARRRQEQIFRARIIAESERYRRMLQQTKEGLTAEEEQDLSPRLKKENSNADTIRNKDERDEEKMDSAAWKSLVLAQPTAQNIQKMIQAFQNGELDPQAYYEIVESLVKDNSEEKRKMGLWALTSSSHEKGFALAAHLVGDIDQASQTKLNDYMYSYNNTRTLNVLDQVLRSNDALATAAAAQVITKAVEKLKTGQTGTNPDVRGGRTPSQGQTLTLATYQRLVPTLQWLSTRTGSTLSQWAQNLLSQLRSNTSPA